jgi:sortase A
MKRRSLLALPTAVAAVLAGTQFAGAALIYGKAWLAPVLIERAYGESRESGQPVRPWSWADTWPVARLGVARLGIERFVMHGDNGNAMAFGPGLAGGANPGSPGLPMISGHRDTHFRFLGDLLVDDEVTLEYEGQRLRYRVERTVIADARDGTIDAPLPGQGLLLVTCYPFDAIQPGGSLRYVVIATEIPDEGADA